MVKLPNPVELANGVTLFGSLIPCEAISDGFPIYNYGGSIAPIYRTPAYLWITGCKPGDMLDVGFTMQVNNQEATVAVECSGELLIKPWNANTDPKPYTYENTKSISLNVGENVTPQMHHLLINRRTTYVVPDLWIDGTPHPSDFYLIARWYAGSDAAEVQGHLLTLLPRSTDLFAIRHRKLA